MQKILNSQDFYSDTSKIIEEISGKIDALSSISLDDLNVEKTLYFSVDMNKGFAKAGALYSPRVEAIIPETARFFREILAKNGNIIAFSDRHEENSQELKSYPRHCMTGTDEFELPEELAFLNDKLLYKNSTNAFFALPKGFDFSAYDNYVITGCCTDICIYQFAVTLIGHLNQNDINAKVIVPINLIETYDAPWHRGDFLNYVSLDSMLSNGVTVLKEIRF